jgi:hypothetical protein
MAQTMKGTKRMRPRVMMLGILTRRFPATGLILRKIRPWRGEPVPLYIVLPESNFHGFRGIA